MMAGSETLKRRWQFTLRTLLLLFIPVALVTSLAIWLFRPTPVDVAITVDRFSRFETVNGIGEPVLALGSQLRVVNRSRYTVWYLENVRYYLFEHIDGTWTSSSSGTHLQGASEKELLWSAQEGMQSTSIVVPISEDATAIKVGMAFTTDRSSSKVHWVFSSTVKVTKKGNDYLPEVVARNADDAAIEASFDK